MTSKTKLPLITNLDEARFRCVFPTCGGVCCKGSRPPIEPGEIRRITKMLPKVLPRLRPEARASIEKRGFVTKRMKSGNQMVSVSKEYCVFYNQGCVLHQMGGEEGDVTKYKPWVCTAFPLDQGADGEWEVRQWNRKGEVWDLFCINPKEDAGAKPRETLALELGFIAELEGPKQKWRFK